MLRKILKNIKQFQSDDDVYDNLDNLWNFMFFTEYFKKISERMDEDIQENFVELAIPNLEVKYIFRTKILKWFNEKIKLCDMTKMFNAIINKDVELFEIELNKLLFRLLSINLDNIFEQKLV